MTTRQAGGGASVNRPPRTASYRQKLSGLAQTLLQRPQEGAALLTSWCWASSSQDRMETRFQCFEPPVRGSPGH